MGQEEIPFLRRRSQTQRPLFNVHAGDPGGDGEAAHRPGLRLRQAPIRPQTNSGTQFLFVHLRLVRFWVTSFSQDTVSEIAMKWSKVVKTGAIEAKFMGVDLTTVMFTMERGLDVSEVSAFVNSLPLTTQCYCFFWAVSFIYLFIIFQLKEFLFDQPEAYEVKIGDQVFRRPGDPPLEEVVQKLQEERAEKESRGDSKEEL